jgi:hypothetical protein
VTASRLALYTTVYPAVERFLPDWARSVGRQTDLDFDVWVAVHEWDVAHAAQALGPMGRLTWAPGRPGATPAQVRSDALERVVAAYDGVVLADSDDLLEPSRIAAAREALSWWDLSGCALRIVNESGHDLGPVFGPPPGVDPCALLSRANVFGLSNSAYRSRCLAACLPLPADCALMDWFLASRAWLGGATIGFDPAPRMAYRQYGQNTARVVGPFSTQAVRAATDLVLGHYRILFRETAVSGPRRVTLDRARTRVEQFHRAITRSDAALQRYVNALNGLAVDYVWWWCVAHPELEDVWNS